MDVAQLSHEELFAAFREITIKLCTNDHEEGVDGKWKNVRQKVCSCLDADWGRNNACAHCGPIHFPRFPAHDIVERTIEIIDITPENRQLLLYGYTASSHLIIAMDRIRIMSVRHSPQASREVLNQLWELWKLYSVWPFIRERWAALFALHQMIQGISSNTSEKNKKTRLKKFMEEFRKEKIIITEFRKEIHNKIGQFVPGK